MKKHDQQSEPDPLESNLSRLISRENQPPVLDEEAKRVMLEGLRKKQANLSAGGPKKSKILWLAPLILGGIAAAVVVVLNMMQADVPEVTPTSRIASDPVVPVAIKRVEAIAYEAVDETCRIELRDGSIAIAEQGSRFVEVAPRQLELEIGSLYLLVAKADSPLEVKTPQGKVLALGTRFLVSSRDLDTRVAVAQGSVQLVGPGDEQLVLARGQEGVLAPDELTRRPAPRLSHLVSWARDSLREEEAAGMESTPPRGLVAVDPEGQESKLSLREYSLDVFIENGVARTTIDQTFFNHYHANTEGTFYFPLPPGAAVSRLAMYVNGVRNEGGMVERHRGQQIYNDIKYANRDPALLEQLEGNLYKLRIFPLEGRQEKRIFLSFTQNVDELYRTLRYWFPMDHTQDKAGVVKIKVRIKHGGELYDAESSTHEFLKSIEDGDLVLTYEAAQVKPEQDLLLKLVPKFEQHEIAETAVLKRDGRSYLHTRIRPRLEGLVEPKPRQWFVLNDTSASRSASDLKAQAHLVKRLLAEADDEDLIAIANLNIDVEPLMDDPVSLGDEIAQEAVAKIRNARRIGGTNIGAGIAAMREWMVRSGAENPHLIYLGDGLATDGAVTSVDLTNLLDPNVPFLGIAVGKKADLSLLRAAADATGGAAYLMNPDEDLNWRVFDLLASMNTPRLIGLTWEFPEGVTGYGDRATLAAGEALSLVASTDQELPAQVVLRGELNGAPWEKTIALKPVREDAAYIPRFWARRHIEKLLGEGEVHREEVVRLSKKHYVATPFTSLIVLENDKMYQDYKVEKGRSDHWAAYPAPDKITVVREPIPWRSRSWNQRPKTSTAPDKILTDPKTPEEILETLLFPANGPLLNANSMGSIRRYLYRGEGYYDLGLYDKAEEEFKSVLRIDPYNREARRWMERCAAIKSSYYRAAYDETRAEMLMQVDRAWEIAVPSVTGLPMKGNTWANSPDTDGGRDHRGRDFISPPAISPSESIIPQDRLLRLAKDGRLNGRRGKAPVRTDFRPGGGFGRGGMIQSGSSRNGRGLMRYEGGFGTPAPVYDPIMLDLTTAIPGLATSAADRMSAIEVKLGLEKRGSISAEAAALLRAAEAKRKPIQIDGIIITPDGRMTGSTTLPMYLEEETISDGGKWYHIYRELGFATVRPVTSTNREVIQSRVPHWPPGIEEMEARWKVTLLRVREGSFEVSLVDPEGGGSKLVMEISNDGLLSQATRWDGEKEVSSRSFQYEGQSVVITDGFGRVRRYEALEVEVTSDLFTPELEGLALLDLPLRKSSFYEKKLAELQNGDLGKRKSLLRHFILSRLLETPLGTSSRTTPLNERTAWDQLTQHRESTLGTFDDQTLGGLISPRKAKSGESDFMTHFKEVFKLAEGYSITLAQAEAFVQSWPDSPHLQAVVQRCFDPRIWSKLLDLPDYRNLAIERIVAISRERAWENHEKLAMRIAGYLVDKARSGNPVIISKPLAQFLGREQQLNASWRRIVESYREIGNDLENLQASAVTAILDLAIKERDEELERRALVILQEKITTSEERVFLADAFGYHGRHRKAVEFYRQALEEDKTPDPFLLQKASLSARNFDEKLSIQWQREALKRLSQSERAANKAILEQQYEELIERALAVEELETVMELALDGYELLPESHQLVTRLATYFQARGEENEGRRWLSTIIDRHPKNAEARGALAVWYESEEMFDRAGELYGEAHSYDSAHPQWMVKRVGSLYRTGEFEEADLLYRELVETDWADQLKRLVPRAISLSLVDAAKEVKLTGEDPGEGWTKPGFDDSGWEKRPTIFASEDSNSPLWETPFFTRQRFEVARTPRELVLQGGGHGVGCEIYLNGAVVHTVDGEKGRASGSDRAYSIKLPQEVVDDLRIGENVLAVRYTKKDRNPRAYVGLIQVFAMPRD